MWTLPRALRIYVFGLLAVAGVTTGVLAWTTPIRMGDMAGFVMLLGAGAVCVEASRQQGEPAGVLAKNLLATWFLPMAALLPPVYVLVAPALLMALTQARVRRTALHRRVFSAASSGLAYAAASVAMSRLGPPRPALGSGTSFPEGRLLMWAATVLAFGLLATMLNAAVVGVAVSAWDPQTHWQDVLVDRENLVYDAAEACLGALVAFAVAMEPLLLIMALPPALLLQRGLLHTQLRAAARLDPKTGILNAASWERETTSELERLSRTRQTAGVLLIDVDHFKRVNDTFGHLAGDRVLRAVADALHLQLREGDLLGRFGGEEFAVLLPTADEDEAFNVAERLRQRVAELAVPLGDDVATGVTISIGGAVTDRPGLSIGDLLAAADVELYAAKSAGRDQVSFAADRPHRTGAGESRSPTASWLRDRRISPDETGAPAPEGSAPDRHHSTVGAP